jgi:hypothetical protein
VLSLAGTYRSAPENKSGSWYYDYSFALSDKDDWRTRITDYPLVFHKYAKSENEFEMVPGYKDKTLSAPLGERNAISAEVAAAGNKEARP